MKNPSKNKQLSPFTHDNCLSSTDICAPMDIPTHTPQWRLQDRLTIFSVSLLILTNVVINYRNYYTEVVLRYTRPVFRPLSIIVGFLNKTFLFLPPAGDI